MRKKFVVLFCLLILPVCFLFFPYQRLFNNGNISKTQREELKISGVEAALKNEVPVGSLLIYKNEIIGRGKNSVNADTNIAAHAEINALNDAIKKIGFAEFKKLKRDSLFLITTFEPCPMCCGALSENNIEHVIVLQKKSLSYKLREWKRGYTVQKQMQFVSGDNLQDSLFKIVPGVNIKEINY